MTLRDLAHGVKEITTFHLLQGEFECGFPGSACSCGATQSNDRLCVYLALVDSGWNAGVDSARISMAKALQERVFGTLRLNPGRYSDRVVEKGKALAKIEADTVSVGLELAIVADICGLRVVAYEFTADGMHETTYAPLGGGDFYAEVRFCIYGGHFWTVGKMRENSNQLPSKFEVEVESKFERKFVKVKGMALLSDELDAIEEMLPQHVSRVLSTLARQARKLVIHCAATHDTVLLCICTKAFIPASIPSC